jgi:hypothetical protein
MIWLATVTIFPGFDYLQVKYASKIAQENHAGQIILQHPIQESPD